MLVERRNIIDSIFYIVRVVQETSTTHSVPGPATPASFDACRDFNAIRFSSYRQMKYRFLGCSASVHTPYCADRLCKRGIPGYVDLNWRSKARPRPCIACVPRICPQNGYACRGCENIYDSVWAGKVSIKVELGKDSGSHDANTSTDTRIGGDEEVKEIPSVPNTSDSSDWSDDTESEDMGGSKQ